MIEKKFITRIAITYSPPTFKFEYTKGRCRDKHHKHVYLERYFDVSLCGSKEMTIKARSLVTTLSDRHEALRQIPEETMERAIEKLLTMYKKLYHDSYSDDLVSEQSQSAEYHHIDKSSIIAGKRLAYLHDSVQATPEESACKETGKRLEGYEDLIEASDEVLSLAKNDMCVTFEKSAILPDNDRFEYDKRIDFHPDEDSSWD